MNTQYNFDLLPDRKGTSCLKHDFGIKRKGRDDLLSLWVADMDFYLPQDIVEDIVKRSEHGVFGYTDPDEVYYRTVCDWYKRRHNWNIETNQITVTPGVVYAIAQAVNAFTKEGDAVLIQNPVYYPFSETIILNNRKLVNNELVNQNGHYEIDFEDFEHKIRENNVKLFLLCSPHNPVGRVWKKEELTRITEICFRYDVQIVADEIHGDFVFAGNRFTPIATLSEEVAQKVIVCTSSSKTFNLAGLQNANIIIANDTLRRRYRLQVAASGYSQPNIFGLTACTSAYTKGEKWLDELLIYLQGNLEFVKEFLEKRIPKIRLIIPEGTYLIWLDCSQLGLHYKELEDLIVDKAHLWLDAGRIFGKASSQYERINIACPRSVLKQALTQLEEAVNTYTKD